jgi:hypothetical protein
MCVSTSEDMTPSPMGCGVSELGWTGSHGLREQAYGNLSCFVSPLLPIFLLLLEISSSPVLFLEPVAATQ